GTGQGLAATARCGSRRPWTPAPSDLAGVAASTRVARHVEGVWAVPLGAGVPADRAACLGRVRRGVGGGPSRSNFAHRRPLRAGRAAVRAHRRLDDTTVRRLQLHGSARLNAYVRRAVT